SCDKYHPELPCEGHRCSIGKCLKHESVCNGEVDCPDGSDEWAENCPPRENTSCPITELKCANGKCIPKQLFCNHVDDCGDLSDEPDECSCFEYFRLTNPEKICDGFTNCYDKNDENNQFCECRREKFFCGSTSNTCVPREMVCDGIRDCPDGEDEEHCTGIRYPLYNSDGFGEIVEQSFGMWHTKCFPRKENLNRTAIGGICMHGNAEIRVMDDNLRNELDNTTISTLLGAPTKAVVANKFSPLQLNDDFVVFIKPSKSIVDVSEWSQEDYRKCIRNL
uniref:Uncharacterized protein n=1 Tax=Phlebotomus papatasi TaxID=29031 RepID=A0A1B0D634_PHLPP